MRNVAAGWAPPHDTPGRTTHPDAGVNTAASLAGAHGLRAYDAVQPATALAVRAADPACDAFACFDRNLRRLAALSGRALVPA